MPVPPASTSAFAPTAGALLMTVADDGHGIDPGQVEHAVAGGHIGLATIKERLRSRSGRLEISTSADAGTTVRVTIPLNHVDGRSN